MLASVILGQTDTPTTRAASYWHVDCEDRAVMTHEMRKATWSGLDGRVVVRAERRPRDGSQADPAAEQSSESVHDQVPLPVPSPETPED